MLFLAFLFSITTYEDIFKDVFENKNITLLEEYVGKDIFVYYNDNKYTFDDIIESIRYGFSEWEFSCVEASSYNNTVMVSFVPQYDDNSYYRCTVDFEIKGAIFKTLKGIYIKDELTAFIMLGENIDTVLVSEEELLKRTLLDNSLYNKPYAISTDYFATYFTLFLTKAELESFLDANLSYTTPSSTEAAEMERVLKLTNTTEPKNIKRIYNKTVSYKSFLRSDKDKFVFLKAKLYFITLKNSDEAFVGVVFPERIAE